MKENEVIKERLCGTATKMPPTVEFFKWEGVSRINIEALKSWLRSFGGSFKDNFRLKDTLRIHRHSGMYYELPAGYIIVRGENGKFLPHDKKTFEKLYRVDSGYVGGKSETLSTTKDGMI